jgi:hypothetical protein
MLVRRLLGGSAVRKVTLLIVVVVYANCELTNANGGEKHPSPVVPKIATVAVQLAIKPGTLYGVIDFPAGAGPHPIVVFIAGSGPTDRDGNQPRMKNDSLKFLGQKLAAQGIAVHRYDPSLPLAPKLPEEIATFLRQALAKPR